MSDMNVNQLLTEMRRLAATVEGRPPGALPVEEPKSLDFSNLLKQSIDSVNDVQQNATNLVTAFDQGDPNVSLAEVMIASQKATVSFQAITQVRNRLVQAYQDVMNMAI